MPHPKQHSRFFTAASLSERQFNERGYDYHAAKEVVAGEVEKLTAEQQDWVTRLEGSRRGRSKEVRARISAILCADWGKGVEKRAVYVADVRGRRVYRREPPVEGWGVGAILAEADRLSSDGRVLATFDAPLGVPESYLAAAAGVKSWGAPGNFLEFLRVAHGTPHFYDPTKVAEDWRVERPFFCVPKGKGGLTSYQSAATRHGVQLLRSIDRRTRAKTMFATSGIPGSVGSATCALWREMGSLLQNERNFKVWPFEGSLETLLRSSVICVGEIYPRAAYATALVDGAVEGRAPVSLAKTDGDIRSLAIHALLESKWVRLHGVRIEDAEDAENSEDDFDACVTAAALLRCELEELPFCGPWLECDQTEGGMLGTGSINLALSEQPWRDVAGGAAARSFRCPIPGCEKIYEGTRGGWDSHVASVRAHSLWHPEVVSAEERKLRFKEEFSEFF